MKMRPPLNTLSVSAVLFGMLAGFLGSAVGIAAGLALGAAIASAANVSNMEGSRGYFALAIALVVAAVAGPGAILITLYWRGVRKIWLLVGSVAAVAGIVAICGAGFGIWYARQPHFLVPTPLLQFEIKPPSGQSLEALANFEVELDTDRNTMPGYWNKAGDNTGVRAGYVEVYFRTRQRLLVLKSPAHEDWIFRLKLPANPMQPKYRAWSQWQNADFVAKGEAQPSRPTSGTGPQLRYQIEYQER
jgi:hypothetical protein